MLINRQCFNITQVVEALTSPENRHLTRVKYHCNDEELHKFPDRLLENFESSGLFQKFSEEQRRW